MNSRKYWERRAAQDMYDRMGTAESTAAEMNAAIQQTSAYLEKEVRAVLRGMQSFGISEAEARKILNASGDGTALQRLRKSAQQVSDPEKREALMNAINSAGAYRYRITRIEELNKDIVKQCRELYKTENRHITSALGNVAEDSYYREIFSIQKGTGLGFSFSKFSHKDVDRILRSSWSGGNYSQRIWKDVNGMTARLKSELLVSMLSGRSNEKTARIFQEQFGVNAFCARRIVRTESAYVANAAQAKAYDEAGIDRYRFVATLDSRTCECCAALDGKVFELAKAKPGTNYPPMHPFCRSTTIADFGDEELAGLERRAKDKDGNTVKVPAGMTYEDWHRKFVDGEKALDKTAENSIIKAEEKDDISIFLEQRNLLDAEEKKLKRLETEADDLFFKYDATLDEDNPVKQAQAEKIFRDKEDEVKIQNELIEKIKKALSPLEEKAVARVEDKMSAFTGIPREKVSLTGLSYDMAREISNSTKKTFDMFPELKGHVSKIAMGKSSDKYVLMSCDAFGGRIEIYEPLLDSKRLRETYLGDVRRKFHPAGTDSRAIIVHELGHALDGYMTKMGLGGGSITPVGIYRTSDAMEMEMLRKLGWLDKASKLRQQFYDQGFRGKVLTDQVLSVKKKFITNEISEYANDNSHELFAELFAEYVMSPQPRRAAKMFGEMLMKELRR